MVYMLVGYRPGENMEEVMHRYRRLKEAGCLPFPMVYRDSPNYAELRRFARWVIWRYDSQCTFEDFGRKGALVNRAKKRSRGMAQLL